MVIPQRFNNLYLESLTPQSKDQEMVLAKMKELFDWELVAEKKRVYEIANASDFTPFDRVHCNNVKAYDRFIELQSEVRKMLNNRNWCMCLLGTVGCGKTTLACAFANTYQRVYRDSNVRYETVASLTRRYKSDFDYDEIEDMAIADILIIDELRNTKEFTDYNKALLQEIIDLRYAKNKITFLVGNLLVSQLKTMFDEHIISRLHTGIVIQMAGEDLREQGG